MMILSIKDFQVSEAALVVRQGTNLRDEGKYKIFYRAALIR